MTKDKIFSIIAFCYGISYKKLSEETKFIEDLSADSLSLIEMIDMINLEFNTKINDSALERIVTIGDLISIVNDK
ncbi:acyl carrier protein (plasmid) [Escherichia coli]|uniref:acyl carrier protein n=1 Tax=Escherichia TaxID=561 RepID=UPI00056E4322|nr:MULTISPECIES: phosphopantetheine-binding protein [Escherichia]AUT30078.1 acyl carrier protein [Escherichia marmotae]EFA4879774.1 acyl carrier protein [Escherichia coli]EFB2837611.1 acyl carrier protein [Escherichia coli]EFC1642129.1 acyl carrier protein [Escherichia coli]EFD4960376.1 acyl carrier protein [Escherichia coli]